MVANKVYDNFINQYQDYPKQLFSLISAQQTFLPANTEDENYNLGTMKKDDDIGLSSNIAVINAHTFQQAFSDYRQKDPQMSETEIKARVVFDFLTQHGVPFSYEKNKDDFLFKDEKGNDVTRENFYANAIYGNTQTNTNFFDRNIGNIQILCLEPKSITALPRNVTGVSQENIDRFMNIPDEERLEILYKRGMYHESIHMAMGTTDERKCDVFALLKMMKEHPKHSKIIFDIYNIQRSKMGYTIASLHGKNDIQKQQAIKGGAMTYLMPNTYKKLEQYSTNPLSIPETDAEILKLTCQLTSEPEFSKEKLSAYAKLMAKNYITPQDLANNEIVQSCMRQGGFSNISEYIASDKKLNELISNDAKARQNTIAKRLTYVREKISASLQTDTTRLQANPSFTPVPYNPRMTADNLNILQTYQEKTK